MLIGATVEMETGTRELVGSKRPADAVPPTTQRASKHVATLTTILPPMSSAGNASPRGFPTPQPKIVLPLQSRSASVTSVLKSGLPSPLTLNGRGGGNSLANPATIPPMQTSLPSAQVPQPLQHAKAPQPPIYPIPHVPQQSLADQSSGVSGVKTISGQLHVLIHTSQPVHPLNKQSIQASAGPGYRVSTPLSHSQPPPGPAQNLSTSPQMPGAQNTLNKKQLKETDAVEYLKQVKQQFGDNPDVYNNFLGIMKDFKSHAIDTPKVIERVSHLFRGHQSLVSGFNAFLPAGYTMEARPPPAKKAAPEFDHAYTYVTKIKQRFASQQEVYQKFLQILQKYKEEGVAIAHVKAQVAELFGGHDDLVGEFGDFLPDPADGRRGRAGASGRTARAPLRARPATAPPTGGGGHIS